MARIPDLKPVYSNLTFGTGGKDKDGVAVVGWGYYEVKWGQVSCARVMLIKFLIDDSRWFRCWSRLEWDVWGAHSHYKHPNR